MQQSETPSGFEAPTGKSIIKSSLIALAVAAVVLVTAVLPAEYGIDPTGIGAKLGFTKLSQPTKTIELVDTIGGNENVRELEIPDFGEPVPLPNPDIHQEHDNPPRTKSFEITIPAEKETEIKMVLKTESVIVYSWQADRGSIYSDFHGHDPEAGNDFWVRYKEHQEGTGANGSLVAPDRKSVV